MSKMMNAMLLTVLQLAQSITFLKLAQAQGPTFLTYAIHTFSSNFINED